MTTPHHTSITLRPTRAGRRFHGVLATTAAGLMLLTACSPSSEAATQESAITGASMENSASTTGSGDEASGTVAPSTEGSEIDLFDSSVVHAISVDFDQNDYDAMIATFTETGDKEWISATVTIDGATYENVGLRLKGNSSLFSLNTETAGNPEDIPWLIRLNEFVEGEDHQDYEEIVIRSNSTETAMNEAVAQELLAMIGLASQRPIATAFTVNDGETVLRLAVENPDEEWYEGHFDDENGLLYQADSEGDYTYRGDDAEAYVDVFEQEVGDDDMQPLIDFLDFINNADDATFITAIGEHLDVDSFATYLAFHDLIGNADDIDGRGNNSYLQYDTTSRQFTVVSWDLNLAFATANVTGGGAGRGGATGQVGGAGGGVGPAGPRPGGGAGGPGDQANVLVDRFMAVDEFVALYDSKTNELTELLFSSGTVDEVIANWADVLIKGASELVSEEGVAADAAALIAYVDGAR